MDQMISVERVDHIASLFGLLDENLKILSHEYGVMITSRDGQIKISGEPENTMQAKQAVEALLALIMRGEEIDTQRVNYVISMVRDGRQDQIGQMGKDVICVTMRGKPVKAKTVGQQKYVDAVQSNIMTVGVGPAGTGKTYLAVACAVAAFRQKTVNRIILTRPAVEAGEKLGFLPGDMKEKLDPYLQPLYDALGDMIPSGKLSKFIEEGTIQIAPLAYMRGRTLDNAAVILDEAQNTTHSQIKMFLTRMGRNAKFIVTGDLTQVDLPRQSDSGLTMAVERLEKVDGIGVIKFGKGDIIRHPLVKHIVDALADHPAKKDEK